MKALVIVEHNNKSIKTSTYSTITAASQICDAVDFFIKNNSITGQILAIDSGQSLNWQTPDILGVKE